MTMKAYYIYSRQEAGVFSSKQLNSYNDPIIRGLVLDFSFNKQLAYEVITIVCEYSLLNILISSVF
jgi:hypothetical protein